MADLANSTTASRRQALGLFVAAPAAMAAFAFLGVPVVVKDRAAMAYIAMWRDAGNVIMPDNSSAHPSFLVRGRDGRGIVLPRQEAGAEINRQFGDFKNLHARRRRAAS